jgi:hypothetical protein
MDPKDVLDSWPPSGQTAMVQAVFYAIYTTNRGAADGSASDP